MGLYFYRSNSIFDDNEQAKSNKNNDMSHPSSNYGRSSSSSSNLNPDPKNYKIIKAEEFNGALVLWIIYPNCTNYEGKKILVFEQGVTLLDIVNQKLIDPHFSSNKTYISPIARFEPTDRGWDWAKYFAKTF
jgi:hypothetical protein